MKIEYIGINNQKIILGNQSNPKTRFLITTAVHGNEICGPIAINQLIDENFFDVLLEHRKDIMITIILGNPKAFEQNKRFVDVNLNRLFGGNLVVDPNKYEHSLVANLENEISKCDFYLDVHSTSAPTSCFALPAENEACYKWARQLPTDFLVEGLCTFIEGTTMTAALRYNKLASTVECGQHIDPVSLENARRCIQVFLTGERSENDRKPKVLECLGRELVREGFEYCREVTAFARIEYGEVIAKDKFGELKCNQHNCYLIMPSKLPFINEEAWFLGQLKEENSKHLNVHDHTKIDVTKIETN